MPVPADRGPGRTWKQGPALAVVPAPRTERPARNGYARTSTARQELASQLEALRRAECHKIFHEQISTRVKVRPDLEKALALAHQFKPKEHGVHVQEIDCDDPGGLGVQELPPARTRASWCWIDAGSTQDLPYGGGRDCHAGQAPLQPPGTQPPHRQDDH